MKQATQPLALIITILGITSALGAIVNHNNPTASLTLALFGASLFWWTNSKDN